MRIALVEAHYGRGKERLSGFGHDFIVIFRLWAPDVAGGTLGGGSGSEIMARAAFRRFPMLMILGRGGVLGWALVGSTGAVRTKATGRRSEFLAGVLGGAFEANLVAVEVGPGGFSGRRPSSR